MSHIRKLNTQVIFLIVIFSSALLMAACSAPVEKLNQEGNQAFAEQAYLEALELYQTAQIESPELAEPYFNAANTYYRQGDFPAALEQMQMALQHVDEEVLAESSLFNLGNTLYNSQDLGQAVAAYTQALLLDPEDQDAKYNLELALQQQEQEQQQDQNQDQQDESESEEESQSQEQSGEDQESENDQEQEQGDQSQDSENQDQGNQGEESDQSQENDSQNEDQRGDGNGQPQEGEDSPEGEQPSQMPPPGQRMTEEQARQLLAAIGNNMETLQERLGQYLFTRQAPPLQDW
ncbi:MAG: tetratricopeptide repeat protein [Anaerolineales bacterium]|nr:tetratricopeptide repeat protein [Anaerolineales bacterium]